MLATRYPICQLPARCVCGVAHVLAKAGLLSFNKMLRTIPEWCCHIFFRFLNILNSAKSCETRICNYNMYTYYSDVIVCSLDNTSQCCRLPGDGASPPGAAPRHRCHGHRTRLAPWPSAQGLASDRIPERNSRGIQVNHCLMETYWNILKNRFEMVWVWKLH